MADMKGAFKGFLRRRLAWGAPEGDSPLLRHISKSHLYPSADLLRLGTAYGGWIIPRAAGLTPASLCYCAGAGEDISFDCALAMNFHCRVRIIDPTPRAIAHFEALSEAIAQSKLFPINTSLTEFYSLSLEGLARLSFLPIGIADHDGELKLYLPRDPAHISCSALNLQKTDHHFVASYQRLSTITARNGDRVPDLLKIDIEGSEYMVIRDLVQAGSLPRLVLIEFDEVHTPLDEGAGARIDEHVRLLNEAGLRCIAVEGSNATFLKVF